MNFKSFLSLLKIWPWFKEWGLN